MLKCKWKACKTCFLKETAKADKQALLVKPFRIIRKKLKPVASHFAMIQTLNNAFSKAFPFIDFHQNNKLVGTLSYLVSLYRSLIFELLKGDIFQKTISLTPTTGSKFDLNLSRSKAKKFSSSSNVPDDDGKFTVFSQAFRVLHIMPPASLRRTDRLYNVNFMGEHAVDQGGPYRLVFIIIIFFKVLFRWLINFLLLLQLMNFYKLQKIINLKK
jgi:hypothetical protein